jgi:hypothetical protein
MHGFVVWGVFTVAVAAFCVWRPQAARIFVGLFFGVMGLGVHGTFIVTDPQSYVDFAAKAPWGFYRDIGTSLTQLNPLAFGIFMLGFETVAAVLILSRGRAVTWGLLGAVLFLVGITPLGLEEVPNLVLAAGMAFLLTQDFPINGWTVLAGHLRHRHLVATLPARGVSSPSGHAPHRQTAGEPREQDPGRSDQIAVSQRRTEAAERMDRSR